MVSVYNWLRLQGRDGADVYDCETDIGRAWETAPSSDPDMDEVAWWIASGTEVVDSVGADVTADVWGFVLRELPLIRKYARAWSGLEVDGTDEGVANGVLLVMMLMTGEAAADSYPWLAAMLRGFMG